MPDTQEQSLDLAFDKGLQMAFPAVMVQLVQALLDPEPSFSAIAGLLKKDPMLAGKVLHVVNTAYYAFADKITSLERAAVAMGTSDLFKLVISLSLQKRLNPTHERKAKHIFGDWRLTLWSAFAAEAIANKFCPQQAPQAYLAGMLKDIQLFLSFCREDVPPFLQNCELATYPAPGQFAEELAFWGSTHPSLAHAIFLYWGLPLEMAEAVRLHHDFQNIGSHPPLVRSVIYATRWAELLHAPDPDPSELVPFELALATELGLDLHGMDSLREALAEKFNALLGQLGIDQSAPETRLYDKSLSSIQSFYFLAQRAVNALSPSRQQPVAEALKEQLRLFWGLMSWELTLFASSQREGVLFHCDKGVIYRHDLPENGLPTRKDWRRLPIQGSKRAYGFLAVPEISSSSKQAPLSMFVHMFAMCLDEQYKQVALSSESRDIRDVPFIMARLNAAGEVISATNAFIETFGLDEVSPGLSARALLEEQLGISPLRFDSATGAADQAQGGITFVPEGHFPATPIYMARCSDGVENEGGSYLLLGDVVRMSPVQALTHMHPDFMDTLLDCIQEQVCLLDKNGVIIYSGPAASSLVGKNIFAISRPMSVAKEAWHAGLLGGLEEAMVVQASVVVSGVLESHELVFSPLTGSFRRSFLLIMRTGPPVSGTTKSRINAPSARHRDPLTGLYGYSQFHMLLQQAVELGARRKSQVGVMFCDINSLRGINETRGYAQGDAVLRHTADTLSAACRPGRDYPCRYGSDKFAVIITGASQPVMESMALSIMDGIQPGPAGPFTLHMGLTIFEDNMTAREGLEKARAACEKAAQSKEPLCWG
ncbi:GGDEF domain-containing protein [Desulfovibrio sp. OttesenSCG-928-M16]|nr:GGDEF domain-containing protein [Desulfovibrio sp. OttesenSCG-928-M16]